MLKPEQYPRLAIILPRANEDDVYAIDHNTGTLPGLSIDDSLGLTDEALALKFAERVTASGDNSIDKVFRVFGIMSLYTFKPTRTEMLSNPYDWTHASIDQFRARVPDLSSEAQFKNNAQRDIVRNNIWRILRINMLVHPNETVPLEAAVRSFFFEDPGMYQVPYASEVLTAKKTL